MAKKNKKAKSGAQKRKVRLITSAATKELPGYYEGVTRLAQAIQDHFKIPCSKQLVGRWQKQNPPFPCPTMGNRYDRKECFTWVEAYVLSKRKANESDAAILKKQLVAEARIMIAKAAKAELELGEAEGRLIDRELARHTILEALKVQHDFVREESERGQTDKRREFLRSLKAPEEIILKFYEFDGGLARAFTDALESRQAELGAKPIGREEENED